MEMDCNLKSWPIFFKFFLCIVEDSIKIDCNLFFLGEVPNYFLSDAVTAMHFEVF